MSGAGVVTTIRLRFCFFMTSFGPRFSVCAFTFLRVFCLSTLWGLIRSLIMRITLPPFIMPLFMALTAYFLIVAAFVSVFFFTSCSSSPQSHFHCPPPSPLIKKSHQLHYPSPYCTYPHSLSVSPTPSCS